MATRTHQTGRGKLGSETRCERPVCGVMGRDVCTRTKGGGAYKTRVAATGYAEIPVEKHILLLHVCCTWVMWDKCRWLHTAQRHPSQPPSVLCKRDRNPTGRNSVPPIALSVWQTKIIQANLVFPPPWHECSGSQFLVYWEKAFFGTQSAQPRLEYTWYPHSNTFRFHRQSYLDCIYS